MCHYYWPRLQDELPKLWARLLHHPTDTKPMVSAKDFDDAVTEVTGYKDADAFARKANKKELEEATKKVLDLLVKKRKLPMYA